LRACAGLAGCANACAAKNIAEAIPRAITINFRSVFIVRIDLLFAFKVVLMEAPVLSNNVIETKVRAH
jgi:hypothetical protein